MSYYLFGRETLSLTEESHGDYYSPDQKGSLQATAEQLHWIHGHCLPSCWHAHLNVSGLLACWSSVWRGEARPSSTPSSRRTTASSVSITETCETSALNSKTAAHGTHRWALVVPGLSCVIGFWTFPLLTPPVLNPYFSPLSSLLVPF